MTDERSDVTIGDGIPDSGVDQVGEEGNTVLKVGIDDLHDTGGELHDTHIGRLLHFGAGIEKTVSGNTGVGVNCADVSY